MAIEQENESGDADVLAVASLAVEDFEEASEALLKLKSRHRLRAREIALKILHKRIGDVYYRALAFEVLYSVALDDAVAYIESNATTEDAYVFGAMIEAVTEDVGALESRGEILTAVSLLRKALNDRSPVELGSLAVKIDRFEQAYE